ncbi:hypothetical protein [Chengkuizengella axinellae]|uniref:Uncharacterized protein n=1 Tax=Chengkuizengella axinellae TaxID=3064388 RepID=A0ABT9IYQ9_9BACL|nr:hypothetical protein [Chengkuizengella sp. 2205SS18-9]MDP5274501.1 hypothetical protein [Chengkuizengella sp. 2205SS18-9]
MIKEKQILSKENEFDYAIINNLRVVVKQYGVTVDYGGEITKHDAEYVKIHEKYFKKNTCEFLVR